jgi:hypothetical protein
MAGKAYGGPIIMRVGERTGKSPRYAKDEFILAAPGTVIAPRPKGVKPTLENAARAILKQALKTKVPGAQLGAGIWKGINIAPSGTNPNVPGGGWGGPGGVNPNMRVEPVETPFGTPGGGFYLPPYPEVGPTQPVTPPATPGTMPSTAPISYIDRMTQMLGQLGLSPEQIQMIMGRVRKVPATAAGTPDLGVGGTLILPGVPDVLPGGAQQAGAAIPMFNQVQSAVAGPQLPAGAPPAHQDIVNRLSAVTNMLSGSPATQALAQRLAQVQSRIVSGYGQQQAAGPRYLPR